MIRGITFAEQLNTSADFAHFQNTFLNKANGVTKGCGISTAENNVYVQKGYFVVCGRWVQVVGVETIPSPSVISGQVYCKVVFEVDLTKTNTPSDFKQGYFRVLLDEKGYPAVTQEDLDNGGMLYQMPWCQYIKRVDGISSFRDLRAIFKIETLWNAITVQNEKYKHEFDQFFAEQEAEVKKMISDLEKEGYSRIVVTEENIPVSERTANTFYFIVNDKAITPGTTEIKASPTVGYRLLN